MNKFYKKYFLLFFLFVTLMASCKQKENTTAVTPEPRTPVTVTSINYEPLEESVDLNATSVYLQKNFVKSNLNGYIEKANIKFGDFVNRGQILFVLKTKEATAIGN